MMEKNVRGALSYVLGPITGIVFLITDKDPFVRFHAAQSTVVFGALTVLYMLMMVTIVLAVLIPLISLAGFALWLVLIFKAYKGEQYALPYVGKYVQKVLGLVK
jgi:uncharacterized membrane protein